MSSSTGFAPGPGGYDIPSRAVEGRKYVIGLRLDKHSALNPTKHMRSIPSPDKYLPTTIYIKSKAPAFSMGHKRKDSSERNSIPGPGEYSPNSKTLKFVPRAVIGTEKRGTE